jgi:hypothetical protein
MRPREFDDLTLSEIALIIADPHEPRPFGGRGAADMSGEDIAQGIDLWRAMTPRERLEWMRATHG